MRIYTHAAKPMIPKRLTSIILTSTLHPLAALVSPCAFTLTKRSQKKTVVQRAKLFLVDLAGSEKWDKTIELVTLRVPFLPQDTGFCMC